MHASRSKRAAMSGGGAGGHAVLPRPHTLLGSRARIERSPSRLSPGCSRAAAGLSLQLLSDRSGMGGRVGLRVNRIQSRTAFRGMRSFSHCNNRRAQVNSRARSIRPGITKIQPGRIGKASPSSPASTRTPPAAIRSQRLTPLPFPSLVPCVLFHRITGKSVRFQAELAACANVRKRERGAVACQGGADSHGIGAEGRGLVHLEGPF